MAHPLTFGKHAVAENGVTLPSEERIQRSLDGTLPAHIKPISTAKIDAVSRSRIRRAFAELAQGNIEQVEGWLQSVASGTPDTVDMETGAKTRGTAAAPARAIELFIELAKFTTPQVKAIAVDVTDSKGNAKRLTTAELMASIVAEQ